MVVTCMVIGVARQSSAAPGASDDGTPDPTSGAPPQYDLPAATEDGPADAEALRIPFDDGAVPEAVAKAAHDHRDAPLGHRITAISEAMMGTPYLNDATGEGAAPDFDPPARYDAYDCLTFVEEVLALSLAPDVRGAAAVRDSLRYGEGKPQTYENRLHFMLQQWVPKALEAGWLRDITAELGETRLMRKTVSLRNWQWWKGRGRADPIRNTGPRKSRRYTPHAQQATRHERLPLLRCRRWTTCTALGARRLTCTCTCHDETCRSTVSLRL